MNLVHATGLVFHRDREVLNIGDFRVPAGQVVAVVGPSGCGKTTLLRILLRQLEPQSGRVDYSFDPDRPGAFGYVSQTDSLVPWMTALENVLHPLRYVRCDRSRAEREQAARAILDSVGLESDLHKRPGELSGGMKRRVVLARALVYEPRLLLMDEPFTGLDLRNKDALIDLVRELHQARDFGLLWVTHDLQDVVLMSNIVYAHHPPGDFRQVTEASTPLLGSSARYAEGARKRAENLHSCLSNLNRTTLPRSSA